MRKIRTYKPKESERVGVEVNERYAAQIIAQLNKRNSFIQQVTPIVEKVEELGESWALKGADFMEFYHIDMDAVEELLKAAEVLKKVTDKNMEVAKRLTNLYLEFTNNE